MDDALASLELVVDDPTERAWTLGSFRVVRARLEADRWTTEALDAHGEWPVWMHRLPDWMDAESHTRLVAQEVAADRLPE